MIQAARTAKVLLRALFKDTTRRAKAGPPSACDRAQLRFSGVTGAVCGRGGAWYHDTKGGEVAKKARKRRNRRKSKANHGKRPNAGRK